MFTQRFEELKKCVNECVYTSHKSVIDEKTALDSSLFLLNQVSKVEGKIYVVGNGGSAGIASHFCTDLLRTLEMSAAVFSDSNLLTCFANDYGYDQVYSVPLERNMRHNDMLVAISSSGRSKNILNAAEVARKKGCPVITLSGFEPHNPLRTLGDLNYWLDSHDYGLVEMGHAFLLHTLIDLCKQKSEALATSAS